MKTLAIISEFNPFHKGHKYLLDEAKKQTNAELSLSIMSGDYVQRGEPAIIDKFSRADSAMQAGFDMVVEMPSFISLQSAEYFAIGSIKILEKIGIDYLCFGIEKLNPDEFLEKVDILILNHGINVHGERTPDAIAKSYEVNTFSSWRLMEMFLATVRTNEDIATKEVWINTSEAEVSPAVSPLYELSKRTLGDLITLRRLDAPCVIRKLIMGPFKSNLNPIGVMNSDRVAKQIIALAQRDVRNIIVTINPLTYILFPLKEFFVSLYFRLFSRSGNLSPSGDRSESAKIKVEIER